MRKGRNERGVVLLVVLWCVAIMAAAVVALGAYASRGAALAGADADAQRTELALESGVALGAAAILGVKPEQRAFFDGAASPMSIGEGRIVDVGAMDAAGLADVNRAPLDLLESLARATGISAAAAKDLATNLGRLREQRRKGLEPDAPAPPLFFSLAQVSELAGEEDAAKLSPYIGLYSADGRVNPMAAPDTVLAAVPGIVATDLRALREARRIGDWSGAAAAAVLEKFSPYLAVGQASVFVVRVRAASGPGLIAGRDLRTVISFAASGDAPYHVLAWSW